MLDDRTELALSAICTLCSKSGYTVISVNDIKAFSDRLSLMTEGEAEVMIRKLSDGGYINLRYFDGKEMCLSVQPRGRDYIPASIVEVGAFKRHAHIIACAVASLCGGFIGGVIAGLIGSCSA